jgi:hypothetical protein
MILDLQYCCCRKCSKISYNEFSSQITGHMTFSPLSRDWPQQILKLYTAINYNVILRLSYRCSDYIILVLV